VCNEREARLQVTSVTVRLRRGGRYFPLLFVLLANSASACLGSLRLSSAKNGLSKLAARDPAARAGHHDGVSASKTCADSHKTVD